MNSIRPPPLACLWTLFTKFRFFLIDGFPKEDIWNVSRGESDEEIAHVQSARKVLGLKSVRSDHLKGMELFLFGQAPPGAFWQAQDIPSLWADRGVRDFKVFVSVTRAYCSHIGWISRGHCSPWSSAVSNPWTRLWKGEALKKSIEELWITLELRLWRVWKCSSFLNWRKTVVREGGMAPGNLTWNSPIRSSMKFRVPWFLAYSTAINVLWAVV